jgi:transcriptional regulator with XRE-family HTH domain
MKSTYTDTYRVLIERLIQARRKRGMTQAELALKLGRPQSFISKIENRERRLDVVEFIEIAHLIGEDPHDIIDALGETHLESARRCT